MATGAILSSIRHVGNMSGGGDEGSSGGSGEGKTVEFGVGPGGVQRYFDEVLPNGTVFATVLPMFKGLDAAAREFAKLDNLFKGMWFSDQGPMALGNLSPLKPFLGTNLSGIRAIWSGGQGH